MNRARRIAIIPARSGSKGVPDKNMRVIAGETLLARVIRCALQTELFDRIFVSTDSERYAEEAARLGVETPWLRPAELASDTALVADAIRHTIETFAARGEEFDTLALLEPSSPLRTPQIVRKTVLAAEEEGWDAAFTVSEVPRPYHALKQFRIAEDGAASFVMREASPNVNRQSLYPTYIRNGLAYAVRVPAFLATHSIHGRRARAIIVHEQVVSIDTEEDLKLAERLLAAREQGKTGS
jgi:CMP-N,N'-diacetyllegionaminic acid synthase